MPTTDRTLTFKHECNLFEEVDFQSSVYADTAKKNHMSSIINCEFELDGNNELHYRTSMLTDDNATAVALLRQD